MKKELRDIFVIILIGLMLTGCKGDDGADGDTTLRYDWVVTPTSFSDSNPSTPSTVYQDVRFPTEEGTFILMYNTNNGLWVGNYTIEADHGEEGTYNILVLGLGLAGEDGYDKNFTTFLAYYSDPGFYEYNTYWHLSKPNEISSEEKGANSIVNSEFNKKLFERIWSDSNLNLIIEKHNQGNIKITYKFKWIPNELLKNYLD